MSATVQLRERANEQTTCVWCHASAPPAEAISCAGCGALYHAACRDEAGRCGTIGCGARFAPVAPRLPAREYVPGRGAACCARCGDEGGILGLVRCPDEGGLYHRACRSSACQRCRARGRLEVPSAPLAPRLRECAAAVVRVLLAVAFAAGLLLAVRALPQGVGLPYVLLSAGPLLAVLLLRRWR